MHPYSFDNNNRDNVIVTLIIVSFGVAWIINILWGLFMNFICKNQNIDIIFDKLNFIGIDIKQITVLGVFWGLYMLFDNVLWNKKLFRNISGKTPDLNGIWNGTYKSNWNRKRRCC